MRGDEKMTEVKQRETVDFQGLMDELDALIQSDKYKNSEIAVEALECVKWWAMEEIVPTVNE